VNRYRRCADTISII